MGPIEEALREKFPPSLFWGEEITPDFQKILGHSVKHGGLGIPEPQQPENCADNTSKADNLCLRYGLMPQDIPATCNGCGKRFSIEHALSCPKGGLVLARHNDAVNEWDTL